MDYTRRELLKQGVYAGAYARLMTAFPSLNLVPAQHYGHLKHRRLAYNLVRKANLLIPDLTLVSAQQPCDSTKQCAYDLIDGMIYGIMPPGKSSLIQVSIEDRRQSAYIVANTVFRMIPEQYDKEIVAASVFIPKFASSSKSKSPPLERIIESSAISFLILNPRDPEWHAPSIRGGYDGPADTNLFVGEPDYMKKTRLDGTLDAVIMKTPPKEYLESGKTEQERQPLWASFDESMLVKILQDNLAKRKLFYALTKDDREELQDDYLKVLQRLNKVFIRKLASR